MKEKVLLVENLQKLGMFSPDPFFYSAKYFRANINGGECWMVWISVALLVRTISHLRGIN